MGNPPLQEEVEMQPLISWCSEHGINTLFDLSRWHSFGSWAGWHLEDLPPHILLYFSLFSIL
jgi:hypothetical protein